MTARERGAGAILKARYVAETALEMAGRRPSTGGSTSSSPPLPGASGGRGDWLVADGRDVAGCYKRPRQQEGMQMRDVIGLDDEIGRVLREGQPITEDLDVLRLAVEE